LVEGIKRCFYSFYWMPNTKKTSFIFDTWHASCVPKYIYIIYISIQWPDMTTISASKRGPQLGSLGSIAPLLWLKGDDSSLGWTYVVY
jgi:hypothetical protein